MKATYQQKQQILNDLFSAFDLDLYEGTLEEAKEEWKEYNLFQFGITVADVHDYLKEITANQKGGSR